MKKALFVLLSAVIVSATAPVSALATDHDNLKQSKRFTSVKSE
ncbi:hypothetical protein [Brevibacillus sp. NRS-1366]